MEQVAINSTLVENAILEFYTWVRSADLRTQDLTQVQNKLRQIAYVDSVCRSVLKPIDRWVCKSSLDRYLYRTIGDDRPLWYLVAVANFYALYASAPGRTRAVRILMADLHDQKETNPQRPQ